MGSRWPYHLLWQLTSNISPIRFPSILRFSKLRLISTCCSCKAIRTCSIRISSVLLMFNMRKNSLPSWANTNSRSLPRLGERRRRRQWARFLSRMLTLKIAISSLSYQVTIQGSSGNLSKDVHGGLKSSLFIQCSTSNGNLSQLDWSSEDSVTLKTRRWAILAPQVSSITSQELSVITLVNQSVQPLWVKTGPLTRWSITSNVTNFWLRNITCCWLCRSTVTFTRRIPLTSCQ